MKVWAKEEPIWEGLIPEGLDCFYWDKNEGTAEFPWWSSG